MEIISVLVALIVGGIVGYFASKKINSAKFNIYIEQAKAKAKLIELEAENLLKEARIKAFAGYMVDDEMMNLGLDNAIFLHCLPAYRGQEVSEELLESKRSLIFQEAENRLHAQKGLMVWLDLHR